jgi:Ca2+-binding EF-hand superfamily protein
MSLSISGIGGMNTPQIVSGASAAPSPTSKMASLFQQIDTSNSGTISLGQFQQAFATSNPPANFQSLGPNAIFNQLDPNGTGSVSKSNFVSGMTALMKSLASAGSNNTASTTPSSNSTDTALQSLSQSLQSFLQLGSQASTTTNGLGNILDAWI